MKINHNNATALSFSSPRSAVPSLARSFSSNTSATAKRPLNQSLKKQPFFAPPSPLRSFSTSSALPETSKSLLQTNLPTLSGSSRFSSARGFRTFKNQKSFQSQRKPPALGANSSVGKRSSSISLSKTSFGSHSTTLSSVLRKFCTEYKTVEHIRNVAVIAHVDHGKTTLVDKLLKDSGTVSDLGDERLMDSNSLEKERGITIMAKQTSIQWKGLKLNLVDTPGHGDFGGEVERILSMVDGVILLVDCQEGPMTQTKFVLGKALGRGLKPIVVLNKMDRAQQARVDEVENDLFDLFANLEANDEQMEYPTLYASAKAGWVSNTIGEKAENTNALLDAIVEHIPPPRVKVSPNFSMLVTNMETDTFLGKMLSGRVYTGSVQPGSQLQALNAEGTSIETIKVTKVLHRVGMEKAESSQGEAGDIITISGFEKAGVTDTLCSVEHTEPIPTVAIDPPVLRMTFGVNKSPLSGKEGSQHTLPQIRKRLFKELENNVSLKVEESETGPEAMDVSGRGELQLGILIENMRREGFELSIYPPTVVYKKEGPMTLEPLEEVYIDIDEMYQNDIILAITERKGELQGMKPIGQGKIRLTFEVPSRGLIGFRTQLISLTKGTAIFNHTFLKYIPFLGAFEGYKRGLLISMATGATTAYALRDLEKRGTMYVGPGAQVYEGMIIGECQKEGDLHVNPTKAKHTSNVRAAGKDEAIRLTPPKVYSLEEALSVLATDQLLEVTPQSIRFRKLPQEERKGQKKR